MNKNDHPRLERLANGEYRPITGSTARLYRRADSTRHPARHPSSAAFKRNTRNRRNRMARLSRRANRR